MGCVAWQRITWHKQWPEQWCQDLWLLSSSCPQRSVGHSDGCRTAARRLRGNQAHCNWSSLVPEKASSELSLSCIRLMSTGALQIRLSTIAGHYKRVSMILSAGFFGLWIYLHRPKGAGLMWSHSDNGCLCCEQQFLPVFSALGLHKRHLITDHLWEFIWG